MSGQDNASSLSSLEQDEVHSLTLSNETSSINYHECFACSDDESSVAISTSTEDSPVYSSLDKCLDVHTVAQLVHGHKTKKRRTDISPERDLRPIAFARFNTSRGKMKPVTIRALLDSGATETLVCEKYAKKLKLRTSQGSKTTWSMPSGSMTTNKTVKAQFTLPELHDDKLIEWKCHVTPSLGNYDMIIG